MSIELTLVPLAIVAGVLIRREMDKRRQNEHYMQTAMRDSGLLYKVLLEAGSGVETDGEILSTELGGFPAVFKKDEKGVYSVVINGEMKTEEALKLVTDLEGKYGGALQEEEYQKLMAGAQERGYALQTNEMLPGRVIHVVFSVPGTGGSDGRLDVRATPDGKVEVHVEGVKGPKCTEYAGELEKMLDARAEEYSYTDEYYETADVETEKAPRLRLEDE